jgi:hypothetical protein
MTARCGAADLIFGTNQVGMQQMNVHVVEVSDETNIQAAHKRRSTKLAKARSRAAQAAADSAADTPGAWLGSDRDATSP